MHVSIKKDNTSGQKQGQAGKKEAKSGRLEARVDPEVYTFIKRAAAIKGQTITAFVTSAAQEAANETIRAAEIVRLAVEDQKNFAQALLNPPEPNEALQRAFAKREAFLRSG